MPSWKEQCLTMRRDPHMSTWIRPEQRDEVCSVVRAWWDSTNRKARKLGSYQRDSEVRAVCELYADGNSTEDLLRACRAAHRDDYCLGKERDGPGKPRGLASLTPVVLARLLDSSKLSPEAEKLREWHEEQKRKGIAILPAQRKKDENTS